jgi:AraC-like DNA-binding protein
VSPVELALRIFGAVLLALLAVLLLRSRRHDLKARAAAGLAASVGAFLVTSMPNAYGFLGIFLYPLVALCSTHTVWFWLCAAALFSDAPALRRSHVASLLGMALLGMGYLAARPVSPEEPGVQAVGLVFGIAAMAFAALAPLTVMLGNRDDLDSRRRRIRRWFVPLTSIYLIAVAATQTLLLFKAAPTPKVLVLINIVTIDALALLALSSFLRVRVINWLDVAEPIPDSALSRVEQSVLDRLTRRFVPERLYARTALTIAELASLLDTQEHVLRRVINRGLGFRNFNDFLHSHRLREASVRLQDPALRRVPILTIALDLGYGSIGPFNRAFRERFGMTPSEYRHATPAEAAAVFLPVVPGEPASSSRSS